MTHGATVTAIHLIALHGGSAAACDEVEAVAGAGLRGDRHFAVDAPPKRQLTLIAAETLEALERGGMALAPGETRRQLVTAGVDLEGLLGRRFLIGEAECRGVEPCEPCAHLERLTQCSGLMRALAHRGGIHAEILTSGTIRVRDRVVALD
ncbi:unannotated protein [freshwater metagenome]|uniref:Unannotated protein n=1 Tax=freshwater metagenome TaxID=449393 RepID=A0A6J7IDQ4_9ZZZZ|nr:MOSC domain-containing protein [Actinomycetota bacterium]